MQKILEKYKNRLIDISGRNRTLYLGKIYKKRSFDLYSLEKFEENFPKNIIEHVVKRKKGRVIFLMDPYEWKNKQEDRLSRLLKEKKITDEEFEKSIEDLEKDFENLITHSKSLKSLKREIDFIEKETGRYELFLGYPFVEGKFKDGTYVKSPLFLFPVKVTKVGEKWYLENLLEEEVLLNKVFLIAYQKYNEEKILENFEEIPINDVLEGNVSVIEFLDNLGIKVKVDKKVYIEKFSEGKKEISNGNLYLKYYSVLGNFHLASSIYNDYLKLENFEENNKLLEKLLLGKNEESFEGEKKVEKISEKDFYYISELDFSQEKAIKKAEFSDALVIYGPPGTGKSQTIANLIADNLAKGKKVLMVSEKRAALDVIYNRLSKINSKIVLIHDAQKGKKEFYEKLKTVLEPLLLENNLNNEIDIEYYSDEIDEKLEKLEKFGKALFEKRAFGLSLQKMYAKTKKKLNEKEKEIFRYFRKTLYKAYEKITYNEILKIVENLKEDIVEKYVLFRGYNEKYKEVIESIKKELDGFELQFYTDELEKVINTHRLKVSLSGKYKKEIKELFFNGKYEEKYLEELVENINRKEKSKEFKRLEKLEKFQWWNPFYYILKNKRRKEASELRKELEDNKDKIFSEVEGDYRLLKSISDALGFLKELTNKYDEIFTSLIKEKDVSKEVERIYDFLLVYEKYKDLEYLFKNFSKEEIDFLDFSYVMKDIESPKEMIKILPKFFILQKIFEIEEKEKDINLIYDSYKSLVEEVKRNISFKMEKVPSHIINFWNERFKYVSSIYENQQLFKEFKRQASKKRKLWSIRKYIETFKDIVLELFPCFLLTPETVSEIFPLVEGMFDVVIFDEASQIFIEKAIPSIYRGKKAVIAGDDKQLRPTSFFMVRDIDDKEEENLESMAAMEEESLLDLAKINFDSTHLLFHYRSRYKELIDFSNHAFYEGRLYVSPNVENFEKPIERIKVNGIWENRQNLEEAQVVVELVDKILKERKENETIGIVTFNITQKELIEDLLDEKVRKDIEFEKLYNAELLRKENEEDKSIFVKNIENVQGDERDIIIFSTGYAPDQFGRLRLNFGALNKDGGENRLNVAISRAKKKIYVVTSIEPEDIKIDNIKNPGPKLLKEYLKYVRAVSLNNKKEAEEILYSLSNISSKDELIFESDFEEEVYEKLSQSKIIKERNLRLHTQVSSSGYRIDIGVYEPRQSKYILGIECDGALYHSSKSARERDIHRQKFLESRGWKIVRIWSKDWWSNPEKEIEKIENILEKMNYKLNQYNDEKITEELLAND